MPAFAIPIAVGIATAAAGAGISKAMAPKRPDMAKLAQKKPDEGTAAEGQAEVMRNRQGRGLASTNLSGMRQLASGSYSSGKPNLGSG